jgi:transposase
MLTVPAAVKLWLCATPVSMRLGFDGLFLMVREHLKADPLSGHLYIFRSKDATRLKVLYWGGHGLCLWSQRLECGRFHFPEATGNQPAVALTAGQFQMVLDGIDLSRVRRFKRFALPSASKALPGG